MLGVLSRRLIDWVVLAFAAYAFVFVPLGERTALQHLRAILATEDSARAGREIKQAGQRLVGELLKDPNTETIGTMGSPTLPEIAPANLALTPAPHSAEPQASTEVKP